MMFCRGADWFHNPALLSTPSWRAGFETDNEEEEQLLMINNPLVDTPVFGRLVNSTSFVVKTPSKTPIKAPVKVSL
jgi:hypothetical protein